MKYINCPRCAEKSYAVYTQDNSMPFLDIQTGYPLFYCTFCNRMFTAQEETVYYPYIKLGTRVSIMTRAHGNAVYHRHGTITKIEKGKLLPYTVTIAVIDRQGHRQRDLLLSANDFIIDEPKKGN